MSKGTCLTFKVITIGEASVRKSSLSSVFKYRMMNDNLTICSALYLTKKITMDDREILLELWDTGGQERYINLPPLY